MQRDSANESEEQSATRSDDASGNGNTASTTDKDSGQWSGAEQQQQQSSNLPDASSVESQSQSSTVTSNSGAASSDSGGEKAETEDDELNMGPAGAGVGEEEDGSSPCACVQCEVCMAENWWRMAAYQNTLHQQQHGQTDGDSSGGTSNDSNANHQQGFDVPSNASTGLDLIGSAATLILSQQQLLQQSGGDAAAASEDLLRADFSMPKLREFFECQKAMGVPNFPEDFDEFWLLVVKARLFNVFKYRGPEAYNRIVLKIRDIARQFRAQVEESERNEMAEQTKKEKTSS